MTTEGPRRIVLDASVAAKWFLRDEVDTDLADDIYYSTLDDRLELHVPTLFFYELAALLAQACGTRTYDSRLARLTVENAEIAVDDMFRFQLTSHGSDSDRTRRALRLAVECSKRFKDMTYVQLAIELDCEWCTADAKVLRGGARSFPVERVLQLDTLRLSSGPSFE